MRRQNLNTRISFAAALIIIAAAMLTSPVTTAWAEGGASSPEALGNKVLESIKTQNKDGIKSLIHPEVIAFMENEQSREPWTT